MGRILAGFGSVLDVILETFWGIWRGLEIWTDRDQVKLINALNEEES